MASGSGDSQEARGGHDDRVLCNGSTIAQMVQRVTAHFLRSSLYADWPRPEREQQARREAMELVAFAVGGDRSQLPLRFQQTVSADEVQHIDDLAARRMRFEPVAYITGQAEFFGHLFSVDPRCLIPRPDTEWLVQAAVDFVSVHHPTASLVDLGCGSGCMAISVALFCPRAKVEGWDVSPGALEVAASNAKRLCANVTFRLVDGLAHLESSVTTSRDASAPAPVHTALEQERRFDVLLSNPPYIPTAELDQLEPSVRDFEPRLALDGHADGLHFYREIARLSPAWLPQQGPAAVFLEVGAGQAAAVAALFSENQQFRDYHVSVSQDLRQVDRVVSIVRPRL